MSLVAADSGGLFAIDGDLSFSPYCFICCGGRYVWSCPLRRPVHRALSRECYRSSPYSRRSEGTTYR